MQNYYDQLVETDVVGWTKDLLEQSNWTWRFEDGKIVTQLKPGIADTPWHHVKPDYRLNCALWHTIMFNVVRAKLPKERWFVPSKCQQCFKVVVRPKNLKQLFSLMSLQQRLNRPSKCGIERRDSVHALYGGYFYNVGLMEGLECYELVREQVSKDPALGPDIEVFLKRACTEYEHALGDSDTWEITQDQMHIEALVERYVEVDNREIRQPEKLVHRVHRLWIEYAYGRGDETYQEFTGGKPLYPKYKQYQHWLPVYKQGGELKIEGQ